MGGALAVPDRGGDLHPWLESSPSGAFSGWCPHGSEGRGSESVI